MYMFVHVQSKFYLVWMLLVVNIVTSCPIGTDCGGSAPVVDLYRQPRLALPKYTTKKICSVTDCFWQTYGYGSEIPTGTDQISVTECD